MDKGILQPIEKTAPIVLIGNKIDPKNKTEHPPPEPGKNTQKKPNNAKIPATHIETSAKKKINIRKAFTTLTKLIIDTAAARKTRTKNR